MNDETTTEPEKQRLVPPVFGPVEEMPAGDGGAGECR